jgi:hypothetical protein
MDNWIWVFLVPLHKCPNFKWAKEDSEGVSKFGKLKNITRGQDGQRKGTDVRLSQMGEPKLISECRTSIQAKYINMKVKQANRVKMVLSKGPMYDGMGRIIRK